ncbi:MAG: hypothetical protein K1X67_21265 [Fimbriimonadaceae bacterium]|nr:hypothetical protein [Fimbriimonadaceae bacterium]
MGARRKWLRRMVGLVIAGTAFVAYLHYSNAKLDGQIAAEEARLAALGVRIKPERPKGGGRFLRYFTVLDKLYRVPAIRSKPGSERANLKLREPLLREVRRLTNDRGAPLAGTWQIWDSGER